MRGLQSNRTKLIPRNRGKGSQGITCMLVKGQYLHVTLSQAKTELSPLAPYSGVAVVGTQKLNHGSAAALHI